MRPVVPHFDDKYQLWVVESGRRPWLADAINGAVFAALVFGGLLYALPAVMLG